MVLKEEKYDIIGIATSGIEFAFNYYNACKEEGYDVRFLVFYPVPFLIYVASGFYEPSSVLSKVHEVILISLKKV